MGNILMKKQIILKNFTFPNVGKSFAPKQIEVTQQSVKQQKISLYLQKTVDQDYNYPLYHFGTKLKLDHQYGIYQQPLSLSILTYNIWFEAHNQEIRFQCIIKMLEQSNADFICLQEVTQGFIQLLHSLPKNSWIKDYYTCYVTMGWYDTLILSKYKCKFYKVPFKTTYMQRNMTFAQLVVSGGQNIIVGSMHYESLAGNQKIREQQIESVQNTTKQCERVIIVGDYNFTDGGQQNKVFDKNYTDLWIKLHKIQQNCYTMPQTTKFAPWRPDHILCKLPKNIDYSQAQIHKIGQFSIPPFEDDNHLNIRHDNIVRTPSDHFGLVCRFPIC